MSLLEYGHQNQTISYKWCQKLHLAREELQIIMKLLL
jgi:hypothetical protein